MNPEIGALGCQRYPSIFAEKKQRLHGQRGEA